MFRIGEFSKMSKTTVKTLRYYDEVGLLKPEETDRFTGYRLYTTDQLLVLHRIQAYRQIGLSIDEIRLILAGNDATAFLEKRRAELVAEITEGTNQLSRIEFILQGKGEESFMNYVATIKDLPECIVYSKKLTVPNYDAYFEVMPAIGERVKEQYPELKCATPEYCFIVYLDGEYREKDISIELCEAVDRMWPDFDDLVFKKMPAVKVVSVLHKGPYSELGQAYAFAAKWVKENGFLVADNPRESYIDGIWNKDSEKDWLTEIQIPIVAR